MIKKHYMAVAKCIKVLRENLFAKQIDFEAVGRAETELMVFFKRDNPAFNWEKFEKAIGFVVATAYKI